MSSPNEQRPVASRFRWVICALLFFSTTFNYLDRQVISYLKGYFCTPVETDPGFAKFTGDSFYLPDFAAKLSQPTDAVTASIKTNLSAITLAALEQFRKDSAVDPQLLQTNLLNDLNKIITGPIYDAGRFAGVTLRPEPGPFWRKTRRETPCRISTAYC